MRKAGHAKTMISSIAITCILAGCNLTPRDPSFPHVIEMPKEGGELEVNLDFTYFSTADADLDASEKFSILDLHTDTTYRSSWLSVKITDQRHTVFYALPNTTGRKRKIELLRRGPEITYVDIIQK